MRHTITGGKEYHTVENCPFCRMNTAGMHEWSCPNKLYFGKVVENNINKIIMDNNTKPFYRSREVWVLGTAILLGLAEALGVDFHGVLGEAQDLWIGIAPVITLILRLFFTSKKLTFGNE